MKQTFFAKTTYISKQNRGSTILLLTKHSLRNKHTGNDNIKEIYGLSTTDKNTILKGP